MNGEYKPVQVQRRGACQYASFRRGIDCPMEFTNTHLRWQLMMELIKHKEFFDPILHERIAMNYGAPRLSAQEYKAKCRDGSITQEQREVYNDPGPFSFRTYLEHILDRKSWGDEITLVLLSMVFQVWITVIDTSSLRSTQVRHSNKLEDVDIVLLFSSGNHYMSAGRCCCVGAPSFSPSLYFTVNVFTIVLSSNSVHSFFLFCHLVFPVHQVDDGEEIISDVLGVNPLVEHPGYKFALEESDIFSDDEDYAEGVNLHREWPNRPLPKKKEIPEVSEDRALLIKKSLEAHHFHARLLESLGVNACKRYRLTKAVAALNRVEKDDTACGICGKKGFQHPTLFGLTYRQFISRSPSISVTFVRATLLRSQVSRHTVVSTMKWRSSGVTSVIIHMTQRDI